MSSSFIVTVINRSSQFIFIYIALFTIQIVYSCYSDNRKIIQQRLFWLYSSSARKSLSEVQYCKLK